MIKKPFKYRQKHGFQSGRSMIEMLGVIAIYGTLSMGVYASLSVINSQQEETNAVLQTLNVVDDMKELFKWHTIQNLDRTTYTDNLLPYAQSEGVVGTKSPIGTGFTITATKTNSETYFTVTFSGLSFEQCIALTTADWGSDVRNFTGPGGTLYLDSHTGEYPLAVPTARSTLCPLNRATYSVGISLYQ